MDHKHDSARNAMMSGRMTIVRAGDRFLALGLLIAVFVLMSGCASKAPLTVQSTPGTTTTYILVRHAEKANLTPESPLSEAGRQRALVLADTLAPMGVTAIYCPALRRNKETVQPLADRLNLEIRTISGWRLMNTRRFAAEFLQATMAAHAGGVIVWVGNSSAVGDLGSNLQELYLRLGGRGQGPKAYHDLFVIVVSDTGAIDIQKRQYGQMTP
jgi:phosphohistidine phosphatase SixA